MFSSNVMLALKHVMLLGWFYSYGLHGGLWDLPVISLEGNKYSSIYQLYVCLSFTAFPSLYSPPWALPLIILPLRENWNSKRCSLLYMPCVEEVEEYGNGMPPINAERQSFVLWSDEARACSLFEIHAWTAHSKEHCFSSHTTIALHWQ